MKFKSTQKTKYIDMIISPQLKHIAYIQDNGGSSVNPDGARNRSRNKYPGLHPKSPVLPVIDRTL